MQGKREPSRSDRLEILRAPNGSRSNSLSHYWWRLKNPLNIVLNFIVIEITKFMPSLTLKRVLLRCLGMKVGRNAALGLGVQFDIFFPELIELGENCILGYGTTVLAHEFLIEEVRTGKVSIGRNVMIGANSTILPGVRIGDEAVVSACSLVNKDIPTKAFVGGVPVKSLGKRR